MHTCCADVYRRRHCNVEGPASSSHSVDGRRAGHPRSECVGWRHEAFAVLVQSVRRESIRHALLV